ncbi:uncharacterized protein TNCV_1457691 [Trichonephila clavipes]|nr:uncharacterized protein TNCV_1457691 [Trichonephila clavipes]
MSICVGAQDLKKSMAIFRSWMREGSTIALSTIQVIVRFGSFPPQFGGRTSGGGQGPSTSLLLPPTTREHLRLDVYLEYPHAAKALYIYKYPCILRDSSPVPTAPQSASLTTIPVGRRNAIPYIKNALKSKLGEILTIQPSWHHLRRSDFATSGIGCSWKLLKKSITSRSVT